jgi:carotenoid cleavage dioxygenase
MAVDFRGHPMFAPGFNSPTRFEADVYDCEVWGQIPTDVEGTFYRVQCDFQYRPPMNEWPTGFNGDGHVSAFRFANGSVDFKARYVKTDRLMAERRARKRLWGVYRNHFTDDPSVASIDRGAANTHIYWHGGKTASSWPGCPRPTSRSSALELGDRASPSTAREASATTS